MSKEEGNVEASKARQRRASFEIRRDVEASRACGYFYNPRNKIAGLNIGIDSCESVVVVGESYVFCLQIRS